MEKISNHLLFSASSAVQNIVLVQHLPMCTLRSRITGVTSPFGTRAPSLYYPNRCASAELFVKDESGLSNGSGAENT
jgi:hypothetical protein